MGNSFELNRIEDEIQTHHVEESVHKSDYNSMKAHLNILVKYMDYEPNFSKISLLGAQEGYIDSLVERKNNYPVDFVPPPIEKVEKLNFEDRKNLFFQELQKLKLDWRNYKSEEIIIDRNNILKSTIEKIDTINFYKEIRIGFKGENDPYDDAGGITREWITLLFRELQDPKKDLFERADTLDYSLKVHFSTSQTKEKLNLFCLIGKLISKALLENLTINVWFNKYIYKMILDEPIKSDELPFINLSLHKAIDYIEKQKTIDDLELCFAETFFDEEKGKYENYNLIPNGENTKVTKQSFDFYIKKRIELLVKNDKIFINELKKGLFSWIPESLIKLFNANELELIINGTPFIDLEDWKESMIYKGYSSKDKIIKDFWNILEEKKQEELEKILQFSTGSRRVPIAGFKKLPRNRNEFGPPEIQKIDYEEGRENFIKSHTCFNRIDLPNYSTKEELLKYLNILIQQEFYFFNE